MIFSESQLEQYIKVFVYLTLVINAIGIVVYLWGFSTGRVQYLGYACEGMLVCLAYFLINRKLLGVLLTIIIVLASGKRGVYLGVLVVTALYFLRYSSKKNSIKYFFLLRSLLFSLFIGLMYISNIYSDVDIPLIGNLISKLNQLNIFSDDFDWDLATSGRSIEIREVWKLFDTKAYHLFSGMGYGWSFSWTAYSGKYSLLQHYVHLSYLNIFFAVWRCCFLLYISLI